MTVDQAVVRIREIQADLDAGRLVVPYSEPIRRELGELLEIFAAHCKTIPQARELVRRIHAPTSPAPATLPW